MKRNQNQNKKRRSIKIRKLIRVGHINQMAMPQELDIRIGEPNGK